MDLIEYQRRVQLLTSRHGFKEKDAVWLALDDRRPLD